MSQRAVKDIIRAAIDALGLSQKEFAERIGVDPATVNRWLKGTQYPARPMVALIAETAGISVTELALAIAGETTDQNRTLRQRAAKDRADRDFVVGKVSAFLEQYEELGHTYRSMAGDMRLLLDRAMPLQDIFTEINERLGRLEERLGPADPPSVP